MKFSNESLCEKRRSLAFGFDFDQLDWVDFRHCLKCQGFYRLDTEEGLALLARLEREGKRTEPDRKQRKRVRA